MLKINLLQLGQGGSLVLVVQIGTDLAGLDAGAVDIGQERISAEEHGHNEKNSQHRKCLTFIILQD